ncbi:hypothetical protein F511_03575 [Dorcoceras hygrometricum]|uniref:Uncharacterized protein n=1 Tax=Dorcoceras hygrometricum TaxID=472368 RepID=A0A2Z7D8S2_9LAMI|nr:hypothetical protein F511_03575 [Dorcoceras hygrometricum]
MVNAGQSFVACDWLCFVSCDWWYAVACDWYFAKASDWMTSVLREIVRYCSLQLVVVTVASDWMAYAMRRRFGLAWFGVSAASFFASAAIPVNSRRFRWLFCSCEVALDSSREALSSYTIFGSFVGWIESAKLLFLRVISSLQICAGSELLRSLRKLRYGLSL